MTAPQPDVPLLRPEQAPFGEDLAACTPQVRVCAYCAFAGEPVKVGIEVCADGTHEDIEEGIVRVRRARKFRGNAVFVPVFAPAELLGRVGDEVREDRCVDGAPGALQGEGCGIRCGGQGVEVDIGVGGEVEFALHSVDGVALYGYVFGGVYADGRGEVQAGGVSGAEGVGEGDVFRCRSGLAEERDIGLLVCIGDADAAFVEYCKVAGYQVL